MAQSPIWIHAFSHILSILVSYCEIGATYWEEFDPNFHVRVHSYGTWFVKEWPVMQKSALWLLKKLQACHKLYKIETILTMHPGNIRIEQ